jgi:ATP-dependent RNA circularization protein (DNA/RNA ligase family)
MLYPKINSLYKREGHDFNETGIKPKNGKLIIGEYAHQAFGSISRWLVDEKIDGTNVRITLSQCPTTGETKLKFGGRTEAAQMPTTLLERLQELFTVEKMVKQFPTCSHVVLFGEGYGPKIQSGGYYSKTVDFVLFDVYAGGWWLEKDKVNNIASEMGINSRLELLSHMRDDNTWTVEEMVEFVKLKHRSPWAYETTMEEHEMEGIVARAYPQVLFRDGTPVMFKLKCKEF